MALSIIPIFSLKKFRSLSEVTPFRKSRRASEHTKNLRMKIFLTPSLERYASSNIRLHSFVGLDGVYIQARKMGSPLKIFCLVASTVLIVGVFDNFKKIHL